MTFNRIKSFYIVGLFLNLIRDGDRLKPKTDPMRKPKYKHESKTENLKSEVVTEGADASKQSARRNSPFFFFLFFHFCLLAKRLILHLTFLVGAVSSARFVTADFELLHLPHIHVDGY